MTKDEFLYNHDADSIIDLVNRHIELNNLGGEPGQENTGNKNTGVITARMTDVL